MHWRSDPTALPDTQAWREPGREHFAVGDAPLSLPRLDGHPIRRAKAPGVIHERAEEADVHGGVQARGSAALRGLFALVAADRAHVLAHEGMSVVALRLFELLPRHPVVTVASVMKLVETTKPTAGRAIELLVAAGVLVETTGKRRDRSFVYRGYLDRLRVGTELGGAQAPGR